MENPIETISYRGHEIEIHYDPQAESPREWDNLGTFAFFHKRYSMGDKVDFKSSDFNGWEEMEQYIRTKLNGIVILPVCMYDHSGQTIYIGKQHDYWDGGRVGFIYVTRAQLLKEYNAKKITAELKEKARKSLCAEIELMDDYLQGNVYGYKIIDAEGDEVDSCWGFYGDSGKEDAITNAKDIVDYKISSKIKSHLRLLKSWIVNKINIQYRKPLTL